ncbi:MAG: PAS domain S-box protein [Gemmatimonadaceae bacterium]
MAHTIFGPASKERRRSVAALTIAGLAILAAVALSGVGSWSSVRHAGVLETESHRFVEALDALERTNLQARGAHRMYLIAPDATTLAAFQASNAAVGPAADRALAAAEGDAERVALVMRLRAHLLRQVQLRARGAEARLRSPAEATALLQGREHDEARVASDELLTGIRRLERVRLEARHREAEQAGLRLLAAVIVALLLAALFTWWALNQQFHDALQLADSESRLRALADANPDGLLVQVGGIVRSANQAALTLLGARTPSELVGRSIFDFVDPADRHLAEARARQVLEGGAVPPTVIRFRRLDGTQVEVETRAARVSHAGAPGTLVVLRDVSERLRIERAVRESEMQLRTIQNSLTEGIVVHGPDLRIVSYNPAALKILGLTADQLLGATPFEARWEVFDEHGAPLAPHDRGVNVAFETGHPVRRIIGVRRADGAMVWLSATAAPLLLHPDSAPVGVVSSFDDITPAREAMRQLQESEARYRLLAEGSTDLVSLRSLDGRFTYVSPSHQDVLGWAPSELMGRPATDFLHPDDVPALLDRVATLIGGAPFVKATARARHRDGHWVTLESIGTLQRRADGTPEAIRIAGRDISERELLEEQARRGLKQEALARMAAGVAHDFNNLLTVVRGATGLLRSPALDAVSHRELLGDIDASVARAAGLTRQLLSFARSQHIVPTLVSISDLVRRIFPVLVRLAGRGVATETSVSADAERAVITADAAQFDQILMNLVLNAREAMPAGGRLRIDARIEDVPIARTHRHGLIQAGRYLVIDVRDNGVGIPAGQIARVFDPFFTTKSLGKGSGLGLSAALGIAERAGGSITIDSTVGVGTTATVYWPLAAAPSAGADVPAVRTAAVPASAEHVSVEHVASNGATGSTPSTLAVIDDEPSVLRVMTRTLQLSGHRVVTATGGREGLDLVRAQRHELAAVVTDVRMPGMTGVEMVSALIAEGIDLPVLFLSGQLDDPIPASWPATAPRRFLAKPFENEELLAAVGSLLEAAVDR